MGFWVIRLFHGVASPKISYKLHKRNSVTIVPFPFSNKSYDLRNNPSRIFISSNVGVKLNRWYLKFNLCSSNCFFTIYTLSSSYIKRKIETGSRIQKFLLLENKIRIGVLKIVERRIWKLLLILNYCYFIIGTYAASSTTVARINSVLLSFEITTTGSMGVSFSSSSSLLPEAVLVASSRLGATRAAAPSAVSANLATE